MSPSFQPQHHPALDSAWNLAQPLESLPLETSKGLLEDIRVVREVVGQVAVQRLALRVVLHDALERLLVGLILVRISPLQTQ